ncbi:hypothetical protein PG999_007922 [Apiospora kogelbergensis]|uniref:Ubiquitin-like protease family profile domain-containing protein n=1 Tax=Apiospora kogelbergensis TaxID=1337665 RepID=A0AAW0QN15_9PEZI
MNVPNSKQASGAAKASSKFSVLGAQTQGACVRKTNTMASRRGGKDRGSSIVHARAAVADTSRSSSVEPDIQNPLRRARVFSDRTFEFSMQSNDVVSKLGQDMVGLTEKNNVYLHGVEAQGLLQALNNLQHSHTGFVVASAIEGPTRHWLHFVPPEAQGRIHYARPGEWSYFQLFQRGGNGQNSLPWRNALDNIIDDATSKASLFGGWLSHEYTIFNWNIGSHWGSSLIHMQRDADGRYTHVAQIGVMDPMQSDSTVAFIRRRLRVILSRLGCSFATANVDRTFWFPRQQDGHSCGLIATYLNKLLIERIADLYLPSGPQQYDDTVLWQPAREYLSPRQIQGELAGLCALQLMKATGYNSRIAVALVGRVTNEAADPTDSLAQSVSSDPTQLSLYPTQATPAQRRPAPVQSRPAPVQSSPAPVQSRPAPVQSNPSPAQSSPPSGQLTDKMGNLQVKTEPDVRAEKPGYTKPRSATP